MKVGRIQGDTETLLAAGHDNAAIAIRDQMAELQEAALDRLATSTVEYCSFTFVQTVPLVC